MPQRSVNSSRCLKQSLTFYATMVSRRRDVFDSCDFAIMPVFHSMLTGDVSLSFLDFSLRRLFPSYCSYKSKGPRRGIHHRRAGIVYFVVAVTSRISSSWIFHSLSQTRCSVGSMVTSAILNLISNTYVDCMIPEFQGLA